MIFELKKNDGYIGEYLRQLSGQCDFRNVENDFNIDTDMLDEIPELISDSRVLKYERNIENHKSFKSYITPSISIQNPKIPNFKDKFESEIEHLLLICDKDNDFITFDFDTKIKLPADAYDEEPASSLTSASIEFTKEIANSAFDMIKEKVDNFAFNFLNENYTEDELKIIFDTLSNSRTIELIKTFNIKELQALSELSDSDNFTKIINNANSLTEQVKELIEFKESIEDKLIRLDIMLKGKTDEINEIDNSSLNIETIVEKLKNSENFNNYISENITNDILEYVDLKIAERKGEEPNEE